jgi:hypothetical protein
MVVAGCIGAAAAISSGIIGASKAKKARKRAEREAAARAKELAALERSRQAIINPYEGVKDVSAMASNPYASLGVATQAAEFQAEQADMSLANTLDALKQTGAGGGGATALAQAALQSKKEISANIEQQEASNEKLRAQGEQDLQAIKMAEAQRVQQAQAAGKQFMFEVREQREVARMDRVAGQMSNAQAQAAQARADQTGAITGMLGSLGSIGSSMGAGGAFGGGGGGGGAQAGGRGALAGASSDIRLKKNIEKIGVSNSGINVYSFEYKDSKYGLGKWQGVMSNEITANAVSKDKDGYDIVDYSLLDVEFKQIQ